MPPSVLLIDMEFSNSMYVCFAQLIHLDFNFYFYWIFCHFDIIDRRLWADKVSRGASISNGFIDP